MAEVEFNQGTLIVQVQGTDQLWAPKSRLEIPSPTWWVPRRIDSHVVNRPPAVLGLLVGVVGLTCASLLA